jgi:hypothetical protein
MSTVLTCMRGLDTALMEGVVAAAASAVEESLVSA